MTIKEQTLKDIEWFCVSLLCGLVFFVAESFNKSITIESFSLPVAVTIVIFIAYFGLIRKTILE